MPREPDVGFDPRSPGSRPRPKAGAKPLRHPGIPRGWIKGLHLLLLEASDASLLSKAEEGQQWPPDVDVFPSTDPDFVPPFSGPDCMHALEPGKSSSSASLNWTLCWAKRPAVLSESYH